MNAEYEMEDDVIAVWLSVAGCVLVCRYAGEDKVLGQVNGSSAYWHRQSAAQQVITISVIIIIVIIIILLSSLLS